MTSAFSLAEEYGLPVFPCRAAAETIAGKEYGAKSPLTPSGFKDATKSIEIIGAWWDDRPDALVGIPTGKASGFFVVDVDPDGKPWYAEHADRLACGYVQHTQRGYHLFYRMPEGVEIRNSTGQLAPGIDVRGTGGYVICWGAEPAGLPAVGSFEDIGPAPDWLIAAIRKPINGAGKQDDHDHAEPGDGQAGDRKRVGTGRRNAYLSEEAFRLRKQGQSVEQILAVLTALNSTICDPPLDAAEVRTIAEGKRGIDPETGPDDSTLFDVVPVDETWLTDSPPPQEFLIDSIVPAGGVTLFAAQSGTGKSTLLIDAAVAAATDFDWLGLSVMPGAAVVYFALEDTADVIRRRLHFIASRRAEQIRQTHGIRAADEFRRRVTQRLHVKSLAGENVQLVAQVKGYTIQTLQADRLRALVERLAAGGRPVLLVLDPLLNLHNLDANAEGAAKSVLQALVGVAQVAPSVAVVVAAHTSKQSIRDNDLTAVSVRGSMALVDMSRSVLVAGRINGAEPIRRLFDASVIPDDALGTANVVKLIHVKSNYGKAAPISHVLFRQGAFDLILPNGDALSLYRHRLAQWRTWYGKPSKGAKPNARSKTSLESAREEIWPGSSVRDIRAFLNEAIDTGDAVITLGSVKGKQQAELLRPRELGT